MTTKTPRKNRTAASIIEDIKQRLEAEKRLLADAIGLVRISEERIQMLVHILDDAEKYVGGAE